MCLQFTHIASRWIETGAPTVLFAASPCSQNTKLHITYGYETTTLYSP